MTHGRNAAGFLLALTAMAYPWLHAGARGPSPGVEPLIVSLVCVALLLALAATKTPAMLARSALLALGAGALAVWTGDFVAHGTAVPSPSALAAWLVLSAIGACMAMTARAVPEADTHSASPAALLAWAWLAASLLSTLIALAQYLGVADALGPLAASSPLRHAFGNLRQKNQYASLVNLGLLSLGWLVLYARPSLPRWGALGAALLLCMGLAAAASRTGAVQLIALLLLAAWWQRGSRIKAAWLVIPLLCYLAVASVQFHLSHSGGAAGILNRLSEHTPDCVGRGVLWRNVLKLIVQRPWAGWGWRELPYAMYTGEFDPHFCALVENAHNLPLHLAAELGLPAALVICLAAMWAVAKAAPWAETDPSRRLGWGALLLLGIHSLVEYPLWYGPFQMALGLGLGLLWSGRPAIGIPRPALAAWALVFAGFAWYAGSDYRRVSQLYLPVQSRAPAFQDDPDALFGSSWLFRDLVEFARLATVPLTRETAAQVFTASDRVLHFSPEPRVIEKRIQSALLLGREAEAAAEIRRYRATFPARHAAWASRQPSSQH